MSGVAGGGSAAPSLADVLDGKAEAMLSHDPASNKVFDLSAYWPVTMPTDLRLLCHTGRFYPGLG
jgi:hypothetical protein